MALVACGAGPETPAVDEPAEVPAPPVEAPALTFVSPPARIAVGAEVTLQLGGGGSAADVAWESSDPTVLEVRAGVARGVSPGVAYVTASVVGVQAMAEIAVE